MINKRGQVTIFIIVAVLVIAAIALFFTFRGTLQGEKPVSPEAAPIANFVQECFESTAEGSLYEIAKKGGYNFAEEATKTGITYYLIDNKNYLPSISIVETEISDYITRKIFLCTKNFAVFTDYEIEQGNLHVSAQILENTVFFNMDYPLTIERGGKISKINEFETTIPSRIKIVYDSVFEFEMEQMKNRENFCLSCLPRNLTENNNILCT